MSGGGWKVFKDDMSAFIGAFNDKDLASKVDELGRLLTSEELGSFEGKVIAVPKSVPEVQTQELGKPREVVVPEIVPQSGFVEAVGTRRVKRKVGRPKKKK